MPSPIEQLTAAGYTVAVAHGDGDVETAALAAAEAAAGPERVYAEAQTLSAAAAREASVAAAGLGLPPDEVRAAVERVAARVLEQSYRELAGGRAADLDHARRAHELAQAAPVVVVVSGQGLDGLHLKLKPDGSAPLDAAAKAQLDSLLAPPRITEDANQRTLARHPKAGLIFAAIGRLRQYGYTLTVTEITAAGVLHGKVEGGGTTTAVDTVAQLVAAAKTLPPVVPQPPATPPPPF